MKKAGLSRSRAAALTSPRSARWRLRSRSSTSSARTRLSSRCAARRAVTSSCSRLRSRCCRRSLLIALELVVGLVSASGGVGAPPRLRRGLVGGDRPAGADEERHARRARRARDGRSCSARRPRSSTCARRRCGRSSPSSSPRRSSFSRCSSSTRPCRSSCFPEKAEAKTVAVDSRTPVVLIVFDEFPTVSLMNRTQHVDAVRFPNFASLAKNADLVPQRDDGAPAHGAGRAGDPHRPAAEAGRAADLRRSPAEPLHLPRRLVPAERRRGADAPVPAEALQEDRRGRRSSSARATATRPARSRRTPASSTSTCCSRIPTCRTSRRSATRGATSAGTSRPRRRRSRTAGATSAASPRRSRPQRKPALYFVHSLLPHVPWLYLPSGKRYGGDVRVVPGAPNGTWGNDDWLPKQAAATLLPPARLRRPRARAHPAAACARRASTTASLIVVTADHGVSFRPGTPRRNVTSGNLVDIAFMPLFVKLPGQKRGRIDDSFVQTIDILPTIAAALHTQSPLARRRQAADRPQAARGRNGQRAGLGRQARAVRSPRAARAAATGARAADRHVRHGVARPRLPHRPATSSCSDEA